MTGDRTIWSIDIPSSRVWIRIVSNPLFPNRIVAPSPAPVPLSCHPHPDRPQPVQILSDTMAASVVPIGQTGRP